MPRWTGRWAGGRTAVDDDGRTLYYIEKQRGSVRYTLALGHLTDEQAIGEFGRFLKDPAGFALELEAKRRGADTRAAIRVTPEVVDAFTDHLEAQGHSRKYRVYILDYLAQWAEALALDRRDLRTVRLADLHATLDGWTTSKPKRIVALKAFTAYLRGRGDLLAAEDPTIDLQSIQGRTPTPQERAAKTYEPVALERTYAHLDHQGFRDAFRVRVMTGMHVTEIDRIARGECQLEPVADGGEIAGIVTFTHKAGHAHTLSLDAATFAACERMRARGGYGALRNEDLAEAAMRAGKPRLAPVRLANLRHTFVTLAAKSGRLVQPPAGGVPLDVIAQIVGHHAISTTRRFYLGSYTPPMIVIPVTLAHPGDPK